MDFHADEQQPAPSDHAQENGILRQSCKLHRRTATWFQPGEQDFTWVGVSAESPQGREGKHRDIIRCKDKKKSPKQNK